jgi:hypothetical protein
MFEVPGAHPGPQADTKIFASDHFTGMRDQRAEYLPRLSREFDFVTVLPQFPEAGSNSKDPKATFRGREDCRSIESLGEAILTQNDITSRGGHNQLFFNGLSGDVD